MNVLDRHAKTVLLVKIFPEVTNVTVNPDLQAETAEKVNFTKMVIYDFRYLKIQLVERCTGIAEVMGSNPVRAWNKQTPFTTGLRFPK